MNALPVPAEQTHLAHPDGHGKVDAHNNETRDARLPLSSSLPQAGESDRGLLRELHVNYRADIDGLRALAVLSVVGFHAFPNWVKGGFIGVDIFFVISGFLISGIIIGSLEQGTFSFAEFYARRIKRIFPALILVMTACYVLGWFVLLPGEYKQLGKHIAAGAGFVSNLFFWQEAGYFDSAALTKPLLHLWSLGVEEQFYIVWPLLLYAAWKRKFNFLSVALSIGVVSFAFSTRTSYTDVTQAFYSPASRFWELLAGGVLAYLALHKANLRVDAASGSVNFVWISTGNLSALGALLIGAALLLVTREQVFPGWWAVLPTLGVCLIISAGPHAWFNRTILSHRLMVWFGLISYPLYLWHWPLLSFARIIEGDVPAPELRIAAVCIAVVLAWLTYTLLEKPIRFSKSNTAKTATLLVLMCVAGLAGYVTFARDGLEFRLSNFTNITKAAGEWDYPGNLKPFTFKGREFLYQKSGLDETTLFIGDSDIEQYYPRIDELIRSKPSSTNSVIFSTAEGCVPIPKTSIDSYTYCIGFFESSLALALSRKDISTVVIGGLWYQYFSSEAQSKFFADDGQKLPVEKGSLGYQYALNELSKSIALMKENNKKVILVLNIPIGSEMDPFYMVQRNLMHFPNVFEVRNGGIKLSALEEKYGYMKNDLINIAAKNKIEIIDPMKYLCGDATCPSVDADGQPMYKDGQHLRPYFVRKKASFIDSTVSSSSH